MTAHDVTDLKIKRETPMKYQRAIISCFVWFAATIVCGEPVQVGTDFENESSASKMGEVQTPEIVGIRAGYGCQARLIASTKESQNQAGNQRTARVVLPMENQSSVLGYGDRLPT